jgi:DNA topoisomerase-1
MRGKWKPRVYSSDVTLNLGKEAAVPEGKWKKIVHDNESTWLARWVDKLSEKEKYVWLSDASKLRQERDKAKYDKAGKLRQYFDEVIRKIQKALNARDTKERMVATACYLIHKLAMRVGDEKDPDEADTVGASTLRVEHLKFGKNSIEFDFLGKDSVRWQKTMEFTDEDRVAFENLQRFTKGKEGAELVFSDINSRSVNKFLGEILEGLTAKVFRTCLATEIVRKYLAEKGDEPKDGAEFAKIACAKRANLQAAITCNHKRAIPKNFEQSLEKKREALKKIQSSAFKTDKQAARLKEREEKAKLQLELAVHTKDYNLGTSLRNYIDPRIVKSWCDYVGLDWTKIYTATLQRKFMWARSSRLSWEKLKAG